MILLNNMSIHSVFLSYFEKYITKKTVLRNGALILSTIDPVILTWNVKKHAGVSLFSGLFHYIFREEQKIKGF